MNLEAPIPTSLRAFDDPLSEALSRVDANDVELWRRFESESSRLNRLYIEQRRNTLHTLARECIAAGVEIPYWIGKEIRKLDQQAILADAHRLLVDSRHAAQLYRDLVSRNVMEAMGRCIFGGRP